MKHGSFQTESTMAKLIPLTFEGFELFRVVPIGLVKPASVLTEPRYVPARSTLGFLQFKLSNMQ